MQIPNYILRARRLNGPNTPLTKRLPPPRSIQDLERDAWVMEDHIRTKTRHSFLSGLALGILATCGAYFGASYLRPVMAPMPAVVAVAKPQPQMTAQPAPDPKPIIVVVPPAQTASAPAQEHFAMPPVPKKIVEHTPRAVERPAQKVAATPPAAPVKPAKPVVPPSPVLYTAIAREQPATVQPAQEAQKAVASAPEKWRLVGVPMKDIALISVATPRGSEIRPVRVGQKLPNGATVLSADPAQSKVETSEGSLSTR